MVEKFLALQHFCKVEEISRKQASSNVMAESFSDHVMAKRVKSIDEVQLCVDKSSSEGERKKLFEQEQTKETTFDYPGIGDVRLINKHS